MLSLVITACTGQSKPAANATAQSLTVQSSEALLGQRAIAIAYSGFREGQHPDRGEGAVLPTRAHILEDLQLLLQHGFSLIRLYDARENSKMVLEVIRDHKLPVQVLLGAWLQAEVSSHETCAWLTEPVPAAELQANARANAEEVQRAIALARAFSDIVIAVNVGNEALVTWNDHLVSIEAMVGYLQQVKDAIEQPVSTADNYLAWVNHAEALRSVVDFSLVHTYPIWEGKDIDEGMSFTIANLQQVQAALPDVPMAIGEAGWTSVASEFAERASAEKQQRYVADLLAMARKYNITTFVFEAFDESWKGNPSDPLGAEKHWGLFTIDRQPKLILRDRSQPL